MSETYEFRICDLKLGEGVQVQTRNTLYEMIYLGGEVVLVRGGKHFPKPRIARFKGSTWGGPMLMPGRIVVGLNMEINHKDRRWGSPITTTSVQAIYISRDGWRTRTSPFENRVDAEGTVAACAR
jgi:hypothetical protein